jgi:hypothetical protein
LKQFPWAWKQNIDAYFVFEELERSLINHMLHFKIVHGNSFVIIILYVDDFILVFNDLTLLKETKQL